MTNRSATDQSLDYSPLPERVLEALRQEPQQNVEVAQCIRQLQVLEERKPNEGGDTEQTDGVIYTHHFIEAPGDSELLTWHYAECGEGEPIVFLHGVPGSWFTWHHQMSALAHRYRCISFDLKGYGQSDKRTGDYRQEGVAEQLLAALDALDLGRFHTVCFDRGAVVMDYLGANHADRIRSYVRVAQHLYHFNPALAPQEMMFVNPETAAILRDPVKMVVLAYTSTRAHDIELADLNREIQEFARPQVGWAVARYFNSSSFRKEWIDRRTRLMSAWRFPVLVLQGRMDSRQPSEFYEKVEEWLPDGRVQFIDAGHFLVLENHSAVTQAISDFLQSL